MSEKLLKLARNSMDTFFNGTEPDISDYKEFSEKQGAFVTLHKDGELRGCIGYVLPVYPLNETIVEAARHAAFEDPRFPPVTEDEMKDIRIEISILSIPIPLKEPKDKNLKIGIDGLIIEAPFGSGLLLPQVATEQKWNETQFLEGVCMKAGLPKDAWKTSKVSVFHADIYSES